MKYLLDTNAFIFWVQDNPRLTPEIITLIQNNSVYLSSLSIWEIIIKHTSEKLDIKGDYIDRIKKEGFIELPVTIHHVETIKILPKYHKDPFDRLLIAQAIAEHMTLITADKILKQYLPNIILF